LQEPLVRIESDACFHFDCSPAVPCFNDCCRDLNQPLTPYDVLRLKQGLGLPSGEFLRRYALKHIGPASGLPVVTLRPGRPPLRRCPFVSEAGCRVYPHRPSSCRTYPLVRTLRRCRQTGVETQDYLLLREPHCRGFEQPVPQTPQRWIAAQELAGYNAENDRLLDLISLKNRLRPGPLPPSTAGVVFTALYDIDGVRASVLADRLPEPLGAAPDLRAAAGEGDLALLHAGLEWVQRLMGKPAAG
jgi:Fe-S-cluster containining protein